MAFLNGKPTKAFIYQDHDAHIAVHTSMMQDPLLMAQIGQNPQAQKMMAEIQAHVAEHLAFAYRKKVEEQLGVPLPPPDEEMPEDAEVMLSRLVAQGAQQVLAASKGQVANQQAQQMQQDPVMQLQQAELEIKKMDAATKAKKVEGDLLLKQAEIELKAQAQGSQNPDPVLLAERHRMEMQMQQERHAQEMQAMQQQQQAAMAQQQQAMAQGGQVHAQKLAHGGQVHMTSLQQKDMAHMQKMRHAAMAAEKANNKPTKKDE
jgi:hypothetical protein